MTESIDKTWVNFYKELAEKLVHYQDRRKDLVQLVNDVYKTTGIKFPTLESDNVFN